MTPLFSALVLVAVLSSLLVDVLPVARVRDVLRLIAPVLLTAAGSMALWGASHVDTHLLAGVFLSGAAFSAVVGSVVLLCGLVSASLAFSPGRAASSQVPLVALIAAGAVCAASAVDLITLVVSLEVAAIAAYGLAVVGGSPRATESALRYVVMGAVGTVMLVVAVGVALPELGAHAGFESLFALSTRQASDTAVWTVTIALVIGALALKAGVAPLHTWAPDVYETSSPYAAAVLAGPYKLAVFSALALFVQFTIPGFTGGMFGWAEWLLGFMGGLSVLVGSIGALRQRSYSRTLGYAGIAQVGYALVALAGHDFGSAVFFALMYAVSATATFLAPARFEQLLPNWDGTVESLKGLHSRAPMLAFALGVHVASMIGIPPLAGFWTKLRVVATMAVISPGVGDQPSWVAWGGRGLLVAVVAGAVVSVAYYGRILLTMYAVDSEAGESPAVATTDETVLTGHVIVILAVAVIVVGLVITVGGFELVGAVLGGLM